MIFIKTLQKMLRVDIIVQIMNQIDHCLKEKNKKVARLMKEELGGKIMIKVFGLIAKTYSYLKDDGSEDKKTMAQKTVSLKKRT